MTDIINDLEIVKRRIERLNGFGEEAEVIGNVISLIKAQEPVAPYMDYDWQDVWRCGSCGATLFHLSHTQADENEQNCVKYCRYCGRVVKCE